MREPGEAQLAVFQNRAFALGGASPGPLRRAESLLTLRQVLAIGCRALVVPEQVAIPNAEQAFDEMDELIDARAAGQLKTRGAASWSNTRDVREVEMRCLIPANA